MSDDLIPTDHFLPRSHRGFTDAATPEQRLAIVSELAGFAYAMADQAVPMPPFERHFQGMGFDFEWDIEDEDRFDLTDDEIRAGARINHLMDADRWFFQLRDTESKRIVFQGYMSWVLRSFSPRL